MSKMTLKQVSYNTVSLAYDNEDGERIERSFFVTSKGGYVREWIGADAKQVGERLSHGGWMLTAEPETLANVIRSEYRRMRRYESQWEAA